jgi:hypothetical protein
MKRVLLVSLCVGALVTVDVAPAKTAAESAGPQEPTPPTNLRVVSGPTTAEVTVAWDPATSPSGSVDYHVEQDNFYSKWWIGRNTTSSRLQFGYDPGSTHTFSVLATDTFGPGFPLARSNTITVKVPSE